MIDTDYRNKKQWLYSRDLSWLSFNERILKEGGKKDIPLLERINFLAIFSSNLDEFYRVRMPVLNAISKVKKEQGAVDHALKESNAYEVAKSRIEKHLSLFGGILVKDIIPELKEGGIHLIYNEPIPESIIEKTTDYFYERLASFLEITILDKEPYFPKNNQLYFIFTSQVDGAEQIGIINMVSRPWVVPTIQGFGPKIKSTKYSLFKSDFLNAQPEMQFSLKEWNELSNEFVANVTDSVLEESIKRLPESSYEIRHTELLSDLKERRDSIPSEMEKYYGFINSIVDIRLSDKNEWVSIEDAPGKGMRVLVHKINKEGERKKVLMDKSYDPELTKEIRLYLSAGNDSVEVNTLESEIKLRIIGGNGQKDYDVKASANKIKLYDLGNSTVSGMESKLQKYVSSDSSNVAFVPVNLYNVTMPLFTVGYDADDGLLVGAGFKYTHQRGFRKTPYTHTQQLMVAGSLSTGSFKVLYKGRWREAIGKADFIIDADAYAPNNTQNFFGLGNNSSYDKEAHGIRYYRARFNLYELKPALQWTQQLSSFKIGPALQYYSFNPAKNVGRFIENTSQLNTYDSLSIDENKLFAGVITEIARDNRNNTILPTSGGYFNVQLKAYAGLNEYSKSFAQLTSEVSFFKSFAQEAIVLANRTGGGLTLGKTAFYQSLFLGGHGNLLGLRKYRYAGEHMLYNNLEARIRLAQIGSYILPGQLGLIGFYDIGKTWAKGYNSKDIHQGAGGGLYYAPAQMLIVQAVAGYSENVWYPYFSLGFRF